MTPSGQLDADHHARNARGSIVIPAHNEEQVIRRTLQPLSSFAVQGLVEVIVVANGCHDLTVAAARTVPGIQVHEIQAASKTEALNHGDAVATTWPRLYLDADIEIEPDAVLAVFAKLQAGPALAARPVFSYCTDGADALVRAYYRSRSRIPSLFEQLWGAGAYALTEQGHARLERFPPLMADDLYVNGLFDDSEIAIVHTSPIQVHTPRTAGSLLQVLTRVYRGKDEMKGRNRYTSGSGLSGPVRLMRSASTWRDLRDALVYVAFACLARLLRHRKAPGWARDDTSRSLPSAHGTSYA